MRIKLSWPKQLQCELIQQLVTGWTLVAIIGCIGSAHCSWLGPDSFGPPVVAMRGPFSGRPMAGVSLKSGSSRPKFPSETRMATMQTVPQTLALFSELPSSLGARNQRRELAPERFGLSLAIDDQVNYGWPAHNKSPAEADTEQNDEPSLTLTLGLSGIDEYLQKQKAAAQQTNRTRKYRKRPRSEPAKQQSDKNQSEAAAAANVELLAERVQNLSIRHQQ